MNIKPNIVVCALYKFVELVDFEDLRAPLLEKCLLLNIKGTLLLAGEGINGTVAGARQDIDALMVYLKSELTGDSRFADIDFKESLDDEYPFYRMKVKLKQEIVTLGVEGIDPTQCVGQYVDAKDWNALIQDPDVLLLDTRNDYEVDVGTFKGAINPKTKSFREFPHYIDRQCDARKHKKVAMFCTGGIRCEKASAFMLQQGFEEVFHLKGGILKYLEAVPEEESLWQGECFVFDNRVAVDHQLEKGGYDQCHGCRRPITENDKLSPHYRLGVSCHQCIDQLSADQKQRFAERQKQILLAQSRNEQHLGAPSKPRR